MTKDDITELAEQAGIAVWGDAVYMYNPKDTLDSTVMEKFANLVAAAEQNRCIGIIHGQCGSDNVAQRTVDAIRSQS